MMMHSNMMFQDGHCSWNFQTYSIYCWKFVCLSEWWHASSKAAIYDTSVVVAYDLSLFCSAAIATNAAATVRAL